MATDLSDIDPDEVSPVRRPATRRRFSLLKADESGDLEMHGVVVKALATPVDGEDELVKKMGAASDPHVEAAVAAHRLSAFVAKVSSGVTYQDALGTIHADNSIHPTREIENHPERNNYPEPHRNGDGSPTDEEDIGEDDDEGVEQGSMDADAMPSADKLAKSYTVEQRRAMAQAGHALEDGSYPIANRHDLHSAVVLAESKHGDYQAAKALILRRAKDLGAESELPKDWVEKAHVNPEIETMLAEIRKMAAPVPAAVEKEQEPPAIVADLISRVRKEMES
ncbi:MAG: hypothetical protein KGL39_41300 [Patescibacteria group bacterium]|nr:hypothetical protein [Patescibacteria group bacterium]